MSFLCVEEGKGIQREWLPSFGPSFFFPLQTFPGYSSDVAVNFYRKRSYSSAYKLGMLLNRWPGSEYVPTAFLNTLEEQQEKKQLQCYIWQSKLLQIYRQWTELLVFIQKDFQTCFYQGQGRGKASFVICLLGCILQSAWRQFMCTHAGTACLLCSIYLAMPQAD